MASSSKVKLDDAESYICQRCRQPLLQDPSIASLNQSSHSLITSALPSPSQPAQLSPRSKLAALPPSSRPAAEAWSQANGLGSAQKGVAESFILLSESSMGPPKPSRQSSTESVSTFPSNGLRSTLSSAALASNLHAILSSKTPISHPMCIECTTLLQVELQKELEELSRERDAYIEFQKGVPRNRDSLAKKHSHGKTARTRAKRDSEDEEEGLGEYDMEGTPEEWDELVKRKKELEEEEEELTRLLAEKERELEKAREEEHRVKEEEAEMDKREDEFLLDHAQQSTELRHLEETLQSAQTRLLLSQSMLSHLESTNVYNDAFQIGQVPLEPSATARGGLTVGTINGLRLGGRPLVEWDEINAAWGLVALCIDRLAVKVGCTFEGYKIWPLGSYSKIEEIPPNKGATYELYASSEMTPGRLLQNRRFNYALVAILDLLRQLVEFGRDKDRGWGVGNIEIRKDRISGHSIKLPGLSAMQMPTLSSMSIMGLGGSSAAPDDKNKDGEEQWTRACRAVLAVLKRILMVESEADRSIASHATA